MKGSQSGCETVVDSIDGSGVGRAVPGGGRVGRALSAISEQQSAQQWLPFVEHSYMALIIGSNGHKIGDLVDIILGVDGTEDQKFGEQFVGVHSGG